MYVAIDIETTGLDPDTCQVLEIAAVMNLEDTPLLKCPQFHAIIGHENIVGEPRALAMNVSLLDEIADGNAKTPLDVCLQFSDWLFQYLREGDKVFLLGRNVGSFDWQFLKRLPRFPVNRISHRFLDIVSMYSTDNTMGIPNGFANQVAQEHGIPGQVHEAMYDALLALALARLKWKQQ